MIPLLAVVLFCIALLYSTPHWYQPLDPKAAATIDMSESAQYRLLDVHNTLERALVGPATWRITQDQINAFLAIDSGVNTALAEHGAVAPAVRFSKDTVGLCARVRGVPSLDPRGGVVTVQLTVRGTGGPSPTAQISCDKVFINALRVPRSLLVDRLQPAVPALAAALPKALSHLRIRLPHDVDPTVLVRQLLAGESFPARFSYRNRPMHSETLTVSDGALAETIQPDAPHVPSTAKAPQ
jgi:hypothetical protein